MIFCAADFEIPYVLQKHNFKKICTSPFEVWQNDFSMLVLTGIGLTPATCAFAWACGKFDFDEALNIGTCGASAAVKCVLEPFEHDEDFAVISETPEEKKPEVLFARAYEISEVCSIEPYSEKHFKLSETGRTLATSSRPVSTAKRREIAGEKGELVDMEGYALAFAAEVFGKKLSMIKLVSDFSEECDITENIKSLQKRLAHVIGVFS